MKSSFKHFILLICFFNLLLACKVDKIEQTNYVPYKPVGFDISLNIYSNLKIPNGYAVFPYYGYKGIVVYNDGAGYKAYDLACPYLKPENCDIPMDTSKLPNLNCETCDANKSLQFSLQIPFATQNGTQYAMEQYYVVKIDNNTLRVRNF